MKTIIALTIATLFTATAVRAEVVTKGGATGLTKAPTIQTQAPVRIAMQCPKCKSEFVAVTGPSFKGAASVTATVERHDCASCGNKWITSGHGKAKVETAIHTCNGCNS
jgi:transposase-like protein